MDQVNIAIPRIFSLRFVVLAVIDHALARMTTNCKIVKAKTIFSFFSDTNVILPEDLFHFAKTLGNWFPNDKCRLIRWSTRFSPIFIKTSAIWIRVRGW